MTQNLNIRRKALLISNYNADKRPWNGVSYEFLDVIRGVEDATVVAPTAPAASVRLSASLFEPLRVGRGSPMNMLRDLRMMTRGAAFEPTTIEEDHDVCLFVAQFPSDLANLRRVRNWRKRSRYAAAFILETWAGRLEDCKAELRLLNDFDRVFVLNEASIPDVQRHVTAPVSFLATATDVLRAAPASADTPRPIDLISLGRRLDAPHRSILALSRERDLFYVFDVWGGLKAIDWAQAREANAGALRRTRYSIVWDPSVAKKKSLVMRDQHALTTRYFESAAAGAIVLGSRTPAPSFDTHFDWRDAVVEIAPDGSDTAQTIDDLEADPARCAAIRQANVANCLRRHDWSHRWAEVLAAFGLEPTALHLERRRELDARAAGFERSGGEGAPVWRMQPGLATVA